MSSNTVSWKQSYFNNVRPRQGISGRETRAQSRSTRSTIENRQCNRNFFVFLWSTARRDCLLKMNDESTMFFLRETSDVNLSLTLITFNVANVFQVFSRKWQNRIARWILKLIANVLNVKIEFVSFINGRMYDTLHHRTVTSFYANSYFYNEKPENHGRKLFQL